MQDLTTVIKKVQDMDLDLNLMPIASILSTNPIFYFLFSIFSFLFSLFSSLSRR